MRSMINFFLIFALRARKFEFFTTANGMVLEFITVLAPQK